MLGGVSPLLNEEEGEGNSADDKRTKRNLLKQTLFLLLPLLVVFGLDLVAPWVTLRYEHVDCLSLFIVQWLQEQFLFG